MLSTSAAYDHILISSSNWKHMPDIMKFHPVLPDILLLRELDRFLTWFIPSGPSKCSSDFTFTRMERTENPKHLDMFRINSSETVLEFVFEQK